VGEVSVVVGPLRWWHLSQVLAIEHEAFADERPWTGETWWSELAGVPQQRTYVAACDGAEVTGYAGARWAGDVGDVMTVAVHPARRRRGTGGQLVASLMVEASQRRVHELVLEVRDGNAAAVALYAGHGFVAVGRRRGYYGPGIDGLLMRAAVPTTHRRPWEPS
jgi:ribosomal-protein-alanine N-acetyltransferase